MVKFFLLFVSVPFKSKLFKSLLSGWAMTTATAVKTPQKKRLRPSSDAVLHMSRIECKWEKPFVLPHLHSIRLVWSTASELGLRLARRAFHSTKYFDLKFRVFHVTNVTVFSWFVGLTGPRSSGSRFRAKTRIKSNWGFFAFLTAFHLLWGCSMTLK